MQKGLFALALGLVVTAPVSADVLSMPEGEQKPAISLPAKGTTMADVEKKFGEPREKHPTVGGDAPKHPPITRWDYDGFTVVFEKDRVVNALVPGAPPKIYHKDKLKGAESISATPEEPAAEAPATATPAVAPAPEAAPAATPAAAPSPAETNPSPNDAPAPGISTEKPRDAAPATDAPAKEPEAPAKPPAAAEKPS